MIVQLAIDFLLSALSLCNKNCCSGSLLNFNAVAPQLACTVCKLCIEWWCKDLPGKESVSVNVLVHLLNEILAAGFDAKVSLFHFFDYVHVQII